jgi:hypothetical protein
MSLAFLTPRSVFACYGHSNTEAAMTSQNIDSDGRVAES